LHTIRHWQTKLTCRLSNQSPCKHAGCCCACVSVHVACLAIPGLHSCSSVPRWRHCPPCPAHIPPSHCCSHPTSPHYTLSMPLAHGTHGSCPPAPPHCCSRPTSLLWTSEAFQAKPCGLPLRPCKRSLEARPGHASEVRQCKPCEAFQALVTPCKRPWGCKPELQHMRQPRCVPGAHSKHAGPLRKQLALSLLIPAMP